MLKLFTRRWDEVPVVFIDVETTGIKPGKDRAVQVAVVRFEDGKPVDSGCTEVNPGIPIPPEATAIHGITDEQVRDAPTIESFFAHPSTQRMLEGANAAAFNAPFDKHFVPPFGDDHTWPWLDTLSLIRVVDRFVKGSGRHKLAACCERHGIPLRNAHSAQDDATAAGLLFYKLAPQVYGRATLGEVLLKQRLDEASEWHRFMTWLAKQPPREVQANG